MKDFFLVSSGQTNISNVSDYLSEIFFDIVNSKMQSNRTISLIGAIALAKLASASIESLRVERRCEAKDTDEVS